MEEKDVLIKRSDAVKAIDRILEMLWEIDIPSPTVPEYIEHHEDVQSVMKKAKKLKETLEKLPAVQPELPWVPCSKKLPEMHDAGPMMKLLGIKEESKKVEISVKAGGVSSVISGWLQDGKWYSPDLNAYVARKMNYEVMAWMPLPDPYEEDISEVL